MKVNSIITGKASRRIGNVVMATYGGETIARQYNPDVTNPNTEAQQDTRARFKLMSQLGSVVSPVIAIRKQGLVSARNKFTSINFPLTSFDGQSAQIALNSVQITESNRAFVGFNADRTGASIIVKLDADGSKLYDKVVYAAFLKNEYGEMVFLDDTVVSEAGANGLFEGSLTKNTGAVVIYAYGVKALSNRLKTKFDNMVAPSADRIARLIVSSADNYNDSQITQTAGLTLDPNTNTADSDEHRYAVTSLLIGDTEIVNGIPEGATFAPGVNIATITVNGDMEQGCTVGWWSADTGSIVTSKRFTASPVTVNATLQPEHSYYLVIKFPDQSRYISATFTTAAE